MKKIMLPDYDYDSLAELFHEYQLPSADVVFQQFENLQPDNWYYTQSGFIPVYHTVH